MDLQHSVVFAFSAWGGGRGGPAHVTVSGSRFRFGWFLLGKGFPEYPFI